MKIVFKNKFFIIFFLISYYFAYQLNPVKDFGDLASENIFIGDTYNLYKKEIGFSFEPFKDIDHFDEKTRFTDYLDEKIFKLGFNYTKPIKPSLRDFANKHYIDYLDKKSKFYKEFEVIPEYQEDYEGYKCYFWFLCTRLDSIKALSHTFYKGINDTFFLNDARKNASIIISIIFLITFISSYLFGKELISSRFAIILALITCTDVYFNAINRSFGIIPISIHPFLFYLSFYFLIKIFKSYNYTRYNYSILLGLAISLNVFNGYPNTTVILNIMIILFLSFFYLGSKFKFFFENSNVNLLNIAIILISAVIFLVIFSSIYGIYVRGESIFYFIKNLDTRIINWIDYQHWRKYDSNVEISYIQNTIRSVKSLFLPNIYQFHVHEQLNVYFISFLTNLEKIFLIISIPIIFYKMKFNKVNFYFFLPLLCIFLSFMVIFENNLSISRANYHFYSLTYIFISFAIYKTILLALINKNKILHRVNVILNKIFLSIRYLSIISVNNNSIKVLLKKINFHIILLVLLIPIIFQNIFDLNYKYINKYQSNLSGFYGLNQINEYLNKEQANEKDLVFIDFQRQSPINIQRMTNYKVEYNFNFMSYFKDYFESTKDINNYLNGGDIYIVKKGTSKISKINSIDHELMYKNDSILTDLIPALTPEKIIRNNDNTIAYLIYKMSKGRKYSIKKNNQISNITTSKLGNILVKSPDSNFSLSCDNNVKDFYINGLSKIDYYLIDLQNNKMKTFANFYIEDFESTNLQNERNPLFEIENEINETFINKYSNTFYYNKNKNSKLTNKINSSNNIDNIELSLSTILFNDRLKRNKIYIGIKNNELLFFNKKEYLLHQSNQSNSNDVFRYIGPKGNLIEDIIKHNIKSIEVNSDNIDLEIYIRNTSNHKGGILYFNDETDVNKLNYLKLESNVDFNLPKYCKELLYIGKGDVYFNSF